MSLNATINPTGHFKMTRIKASTMEVVEELEFDNLITNIGIDRMGASTYYAAGNSTGGWLIPNLYVGSGNTIPTVNDTAMAAQVASTSNVQSAVVNTIITGNGGHRWVVTYRFGMGVAAGTLAEVGTGWSANSTNSLFSRALIKDQLGNPTTITILADEILDVTYTITVNYSPESTGTIILNGQSHTWVMRPAKSDVTQTTFTDSHTIRGTWSNNYATNWNSPIYAINYIEAYVGTSALGTITGYPSGTSIGVLSSSFVSTIGAYDALTKTRAYSIGADLNFWNHATGIGAIVFALVANNYASGNTFLGSGVTGLLKYQISFNPPIPKTSAQRLRLDFGITFSNT